MVRNTRPPPRLQEPAANEPDWPVKDAGASAFWRHRLRSAVAKVALQLQPALPEQLVAGRVPTGRLQILALHALVARSNAATPEALSALHRAWWTSAAALEHHGAAAQLDDHAADALLEPLQRAMQDLGSKTLCEIGCGNGRMLHRLAASQPQLQKLIGLDLSLDQVLANRRQPRDCRIHYRAADALDWIPEHAVPQQAYLCAGGVLAYFSQRELVRLFADIAAPTSAVIAFAEPMADGYNVDGAGDSVVSGRRRRFSHPYPALLAEAGLDVLWSRETRRCGQRWLLMVARRWLRAG